jgi:hypothetical protein
LIIAVLLPQMLIITTCMLADILYSPHEPHHAQNCRQYKSIWSCPRCAAVDAGDDAASTSTDDTPTPTPTKTPSRKSKGGKSSGSSSTADDKGLRSNSFYNSMFGWLSSESNPLPAPVAALGLLFMLGLMMLYTIHCVGVSADMYSAPSIVLQVGWGVTWLPRDFDVVCTPGCVDCCGCALLDCVTVGQFVMLHTAVHSAMHWACCSCWG